MPDVVVVGGGIIGAACAHELASRGASVTLIERDELAAGASGRNQGLWLLPTDPELGPMARLSLACYLELAPAAPLPVHLDTAPLGYLLVALDDAESADAARTAEAMRANGIRVDPVSPEALRELEPALTPEAVGGWLIADGHRIDPGALTVGLALLAARDGADIHHHLHVRALVQEDDRIRGVVTDDGRIDANAVVVAAGPWSAGLLDPIGVRLPVTAARGWLVRVAPGRDLLDRLVEQAGWRDSLDRGDAARPVRAEQLAAAPPRGVVGTLLHPSWDTTLMIGSSRQAAVTPEPEDPSVPSRMLAGAARLVPAVAEADVRSSWWGIRPVTPDERPIVGIVREGLVVATGHGSEGVILGAGTAQLVASLIGGGGDPPFDPAPFDPFRFL